MRNAATVSLALVSLWGAICQYGQEVNSSQHASQLAFHNVVWKMFPQNAASLGTGKTG